MRSPFNRLKGQREISLGWGKLLSGICEQRWNHMIYDCGAAGSNDSRRVSGCKHTQDIHETLGHSKAR